MLCESYKMCIDDCDTLIKKYDEKSINYQFIQIDPAHLSALLELYHRKAQCYAFLKEYENSLNNYTWICDHSPVDTTSIQNEMAHLLEIRKCDEMLKKAQNDLKSGKIDEAVEGFSGILNVIPNYMPALVNRSNCYFQKSNLNASLSDCNKCFELMDKVPPEVDFSKPLGKENVDKWKLVLYVRRGIILTKLGDLKSACSDYEKARVLDPNNEEVKKDYLQIKARLLPVAKN